MTGDNNRLCRKKYVLRKAKDIDFLFNEKKPLYHGKKLTAFYVLPHVIEQKESNISYEVKVFFSVPKRAFSKATLRNKLKRLMFEAYRLNQGKVENPIHEFDKKTSQVLLLGIFYRCKIIASYAEISEEMLVILEHLTKLNNS